MRVIFLAALLLGALATWTKPADIYSSGSLFFAKELYTDPSTGIHHILHGSSFATVINYWQVNADDTVKLKLQFHDASLAGFFAGRIFGLGDGKNLYVQFMGLRRVGSNNVFDQWFGESTDGGATWSALVRVPRDNMADSCHRFGDAAVATSEGRLFIYYHVECPPDFAKMYYVTRPPGSKVFTSEKLLYEDSAFNQIRPSVTAEVTLKNGKPLLHVIWGNYDSTLRPVMYTQSGDNGVTWTTPKQISNAGDFYSGFMMLTSTSNAKAAGSTVAGTYAVSPPHKLRMFYSNNNGEKFDVIEATHLHQDLYTWDFRTNAMCICGPKPTLYVLTQTHDDLIEYAVWDLATMKVERPEDPFEDIIRGYGVRLSCSIVNNKPIVTALVPVYLEDKMEHLYIAHDVRA